MITLVGIWLSVITGVAFGLASVPLLLYIAFDLRKPVPQLLTEFRNPSKKASNGGTWESSLSAARHVSDHRALMGDPVVVELTLKNTGQKIVRAFIRDSIPERAQMVKGGTSLICSLERNSETTLRYQLRFEEPGVYQFGACSVRAGSMFGLAERSLVISAPLTMRIYPRHLAKRVETRPARAFAWSGATPSRFKGGRLDFMNIREYSTGDPLKSVNWKASGRLGKTLVNEWRAERGLDCVLIVDLSSGGLQKVGGWTSRGDVVTSAYELACSLVHAGNRVGLLVMGGQLERIRPGFGSKQLKAMVEMLVSSGEGKVWSMKYAEGFLEMFFSRQYTLREGTLFFVFAWPSTELVSSVASLAGKGFSCNSIFVDTLGREGEELTKFRYLKASDVEFGSRYARAEADFMKSTLAAISNVYAWKAGEGFIEVERRSRR